MWKDFFVACCFFCFWLFRKETKHFLLATLRLAQQIFTIFSIVLIVLILLLKSILCFSLVASYLCCNGLVSNLKLTLRSYRIRSSRPKLFCKKIVLRNFSKFTGKHLCQSLFLIKLQAWGLRPATLLKKRMFMFPGPRPFAWPPTLVLAPNLYLPALAPDLHLPALAPHLLFTGPGTKFVFTDPGSHLVFTPNLYFPA